MPQAIDGLKNQSSRELAKAEKFAKCTELFQGMAGESNEA